MASYENKGKNEDDWYTPPHVFKALECQFDVDVAAPVDRKYCHVPAKSFITEDSLNKEWNGFFWCNPPFSGRNSKELWLNKARDSNNGIVLAPDRSSTAWWQNATKQCDMLFAVEGKIKFIKPDGSIGSSPSVGTTLFAYGEEAVFALIRAECNGLGITLSRKRKSYSHA